MKINICLLMVLLALLSFIIISGCGGGSNSINPASSITTPTPASNFGYITINIAWPHGSKDEKKCLITSENDVKTITASMPSDTELVIVKIRDYDDKYDTSKLLDPNNATHRFEWDSLKEIDTAKIGPLPAIKVIVRAEAYNASSDEIPISVAEQEFQIKPGDPPPEIGDYNTVDLALGDYEIGLTPTAPSPGDNCDAVINTTLSIEYPTPVGTPAPAPSSKPVGNRTLKFEVSNVRYTGLTPNVTVVPEDIVIEPSQLPLDENGTGRVKVTANIKPVTATIMSMLMNSDETDILSWNKCEVIISPTPTATPTATSIPQTIPPYPTFIEGTWQELDSNNKPIQSHIITVTEPVDTLYYTPRIWMGITVTDENGQTQEGRSYN